MLYKLFVKKRMNMKTALLPLLLTTSFLCGEWDPESCIVDDPHLASVLENQKFQDLKIKVFEHLKDSWCSKEKAELLMDLTLMTCPKVSVEVGAFTGSSVLPVAVTLKHIGKGKIYAIDAWSNKEAIKNLSPDDPNRSWWKTVDMKAAAQIFNKLVEDWGLKPYCKVIAKPSCKASLEIKEIDFLHLDGDYSEVGSLEDVALYTLKVKSGGYILFSNLYVTIHGVQPRLKAFCTLFETCDMVAEIENGNTILFRKR